MDDDERVAGLPRAWLRGVLGEGPPPLFATLSGAHLYGFPSPDSDVDLRGAFVLPLREVLALEPPEETRTVSRVDAGRELDWVAHDLRKFCGLMLRRNGYVLEQLTSPLVVWGGPWLDELRELGRGCVVRHLVHHYRGFVHTQRRELERRPSVKALLYAYRVLLTGVHVLRRGEVEANLHRLAERHPELAPPELPDLIARKLAGAEHAALTPAEATAHLPRLDALEGALDDAHAASTLPDEPTTRAALSDYVVRARLALGGAA